MKRRDFLKAGMASVVGTVAGSSALLIWNSRAHASAVNVNLTMLAGDVTMIDDTVAYMFSFSNSGSIEFPGPTIVCQEGDTVNVNLYNTLNTMSSFKVGGTNIYQTVVAGGSDSVSFSAPAPGSYLYYDDLNGGVNRVMGLHGALIVMPKCATNQSFSGGPTFVRQYKWVLGNVDPLWGEAVRINGHDYVTNPALSVDTFKPRYFTINGQSYERTHHANTELAGHIGEPALVRILNAGMVTHSPHFHGNHVDIISVNHQNFPAERVKSKDVVSMFPFDSRDVIYPFKSPPDAWPPAQGEQHFPMHCHSEPSQTAAGGMYPHGMHASIVIGHAPSLEPEL